MQQPNCHRTPSPTSLRLPTHCAGVACNAPPAAVCANATTRRTFAATGTCNGGACSYASANTVCPAPANADPVCAGGACSFTCRAGLVPVNASCVAADEAIGDDPWISAGELHTCGVKSDGSVACWGDNYNDQSSPPAGSFRQVSAGDTHTCGVKSDGTVACWGKNDNGESSPPAGALF